MREVAFGQDGSISTEGFETRYNTELANEYGNLASRTLAMIGRYRDGVVPDAEPDPGVAAAFDGLDDAVRARLDRVEVTAALEEIWQRVRALNRFVQDEEPWKVSKDEARAGDLDRILYTAAEGLRVVSVLIHPWIPEAAEKLLAALGQEDLALECAQLGARSGRRRRSATSASSSRRSTRAARRSSWSTRTATSTPASRPTRSWWPSARAVGVSGSPRSA